VVRPDHLIHRFGADALRYFIAREMSFGQDANFSDEAFLERFNADLANSLGNTASRTTAMTSRYLEGIVPSPSSDGPVPEAAATAVEKYLEHMDAFEPNRALEAAWQLLSTINVFLQEKQPWNLAKNGDDGRKELESVLYAALEGLRISSILADPFMPGIAAALRQQLGADDIAVDLGQATKWGGLPAGTKLGDAQPLFPRVDIKAYLKEIEVEKEKKAEAAAIAQGELVTIDDFAKIKLKVGLVTSAEPVPKSKKLMKIMVDLGESELRQLVAGIAERYTAEELVGRRIVVVANLQPTKLMGVESRGMLLAASIDGAPYLLSADDEVPPGTGVR
jgi:methionyl-tRNA synthetase